MQWFLQGPVIGILFMNALSAETALESLNRPGPLVIAHRGFSARAPENTLPAFRLALEAGADLVELDYHHSAEGVPVVLHDHTLDRTTDAREQWGGKDIPVHSRTLEELGRLDAGRWFHPRFAGTRIQTLAAALAEIQPRGLTLIERKSGDAESLARLLKQQDLLRQVVVQAFDWEFLKQMRELCPQLALGALGPPGKRNGRELSSEEKALSVEYLEEIQRFGAQLVVWNRQVDPAMIREAGRRGQQVWVYTINDPTEADHLLGMGVRGLITDDPERLRRESLKRANPN